MSNDKPTVISIENYWKISGLRPVAYFGKKRQLVIAIRKIDTFWYEVDYRYEGIIGGVSTRMLNRHSHLYMQGTVVNGA